MISMETEHTFWVGCNLQVGFVGLTGILVVFSFHQHLFHGIATCIAWSGFVAGYNRVKLSA